VCAFQFCGSHSFVLPIHRILFYYSSWSNQQIGEQCWQAILRGGRTRRGLGKTSNNSITRRRSVTLPGHASKCERNFVKMLLVTVSTVAYPLLFLWHLFSKIFGAKCFCDNIVIQTNMGERSESMARNRDEYNRKDIEIFRKTLCI